MKMDKKWKSKTIVSGVVLGAITGLVAAIILVERAEKNQTKPNISTGEGVKLGLGVLGLLKLISEYGEK